MSHKLDIFKTLEKIDRKDREFWKSLSDEEKKGFTAFVIIQWMVGTKDAAQIFFLNELVNPFIFSFGKNDSELLYYLMCACSSGRKQRYQWIKKKKTSRFPKSVKVIQEYYNYNKKHAEDALKCFNKDDIIGMGEELGYQKEELKSLRVEANGLF